MSTPNGRMLSRSFFSHVFCCHDFSQSSPDVYHLHALPLKGKQKGEDVRNHLHRVPSLSSSLSEDHCSGCTNIHFFDCMLSFVVPCSFLFFHVARYWSIYMVVSPEHFLPALRRAFSPLSCLFTHIFSSLWSEKKIIKEVFIKVFLTFVKNEEMLSRGYEFKVHI